MKIEVHPVSLSFLTLTYKTVSLISAGDTKSCWSGVNLWWLDRFALSSPAVDAEMGELMKHCSAEWFTLWQDLGSCRGPGAVSAVNKQWGYLSAGWRCGPWACGALGHVGLLVLRSAMPGGQRPARPWPVPSGSLAPLLHGCGGSTWGPLLSSELEHGFLVMGCLVSLFLTTWGLLAQVRGPFLSALDLWSGCGCSPLPPSLYTIHVAPLAYNWHTHMHKHSFTHITITIRFLALVIIINYSDFLLIYLLLVMLLLFVCCVFLLIYVSAGASDDPVYGRSLLSSLSTNAVVGYPVFG